MFSTCYFLIFIIIFEHIIFYSYIFFMQWTLKWEVKQLQTKRSCNWCEEYINVYLFIWLYFYPLQWEKNNYPLSRFRMDKLVLASSSYWYMWQGIWISWNLTCWWYSLILIGLNCNLPHHLLLDTFTSKAVVGLHKVICGRDAAIQCKYNLLENCKNANFKYSIS